MTAVGLHLEPAEPKSSRMIHAETLKLARISLKDFPAHVQRALEWATLARSARIPSEKFTHLWLCILTLASHKQPKKMNDMPRIRAYVESMTYGTGGVLSHSRAENLASELSRFYDLRNDLLHRSDDSSLSSQLLDKLETVAYQLIDFELRKLSVALPAS
jgi:hypothetical protein